MGPIDGVYKLLFILIDSWRDAIELYKIWPLDNGIHCYFSIGHLLAVLEHPGYAVGGAGDAAGDARD